MTTLRDYQRNGINEIKKAWEKGKTPLISVATGGGKTTMITHLISESLPPKGRALVIVHTEEIVNQIYRNIQNLLVNGVGIVMGIRNQTQERIIVASRQSLQYRLDQIIQFNDISIVVIDEAHHATKNNSYGKLITRILKKTPWTKVVGFTATPQVRNQGLFDGVFFYWTTQDGIRSGFLVPPLFISIKVSRKNFIQQSIKAFQTHVIKQKRHCLAFFPSVQSSLQFTKALQRKQIPAAHIDCRTPRIQRESLLAEYSKGNIIVISNMQVLTEGFDAPITSAIFIARQPKSKLLMTQIIGRGLRPFPNKKNCLIIQLSF
jgi:ATP-dependent helicase IRC3